MKKFLIKTPLMFIVSILPMVALELFIVYYPSAFNTKAQYINSNSKSIECLFLGSSHTQNGVNPEFIQTPSANLAYGGQDIQLDSALFFRYVSPKLKYIVLELDYHTLEKKKDASYWRLPWYYKYYGLDIFNQFDFKDRISLFYTNPYFFKKYISRILFPKKRGVQD